MTDWKALYEKWDSVSPELQQKVFDAFLKRTRDQLKVLFLREPYAKLIWMKIPEEKRLPPKPKFSKGQKVMYQGTLFNITGISEEPPLLYTLQTPDRGMFRSYVPEAELALPEVVKPPPPKPPVPVEKRVPVKVEISKSKPGEYTINWSLKEWKLEKVPERPIMFSLNLTMAEVERTVAAHEEFYDASEIQRFAGEDWYEELPQEFKESATLVWTDEQVTWSEDAAKDREIFHYEYKREDLEPMTVEDLRNIAAIKNLSTKGKKEDLIATILGIEKPPEVAPPPIPPPKVEKPPVAPPPVKPPPPLVPMKGLQKADEKRLLVRFDALLLERTITPAKWRPMFEDRLYDWREAFKDLPRDEAMEKAFSEVEKLVGDIVGLAKPPPVRRPPEVAPPGAPPAAPEVYVPPAEVLGPRIPRIRIRKCWVADCPETFEADEDLENRVRMVPVMKADTPHLGPRYEPLLRFPPIFYYLCPTHRDERFGYRDVFDALAYLYFETESSKVKRLTVTKESFRDIGLSVEDMTIIQERAARWRPE